MPERKRYPITDAGSYDTILASVTLSDALERMFTTGEEFILSPLVQTLPERKLVGFTLRAIEAIEAEPPTPGVNPPRPLSHPGGKVG